MDERDLRKGLSGLPLGEVRSYARTSSTNDVALAWATEGAPDLSLVYAEEQTAGRGRGSRRWFTLPETALACSLVLRPSPVDGRHIPRFSGLGALAVVDGLGGMGLQPEIKWPNDILVRGKKVCGILVDAVWTGGSVESLVLGIGLNVRPESVPPQARLTYPATCLDTELGRGVDRLDLLRRLLEAFLSWRPRLARWEFLQAWEGALAFRGSEVEVSAEGGLPRHGLLEGLEEDGSLRLRASDGSHFTLQFGEVHLRPLV